MMRISELENGLPMVRDWNAARSIGSATASALGTTVEVFSIKSSRPT
jgi:hypothetical protein